MTELRYPKKGKRLSTKRQADARIDKAESAKVRRRSGGMCEWCGRPAVHVHHKLGGHGTRGRKESALARNKLHLCAECHAAIHAGADVLRRRRKLLKRLAG